MERTEVSPSSTAHKVRWAELLPPTPESSWRTEEEKQDMSSLGTAGRTSISCFLALMAYPWTRPLLFRIRRDPLGTAVKASTWARLYSWPLCAARRDSCRASEESVRGSNRSPSQTASQTAWAAAGSGAARTTTKSLCREPSRSWAKTSAVLPGTSRIPPRAIPKAENSCRRYFCAPSKRL